MKRFKVCWNDKFSGYDVWEDNPWWALFNTINFPILIFCDNLSECVDELIDYCKKRRIDKYKITIVRREE